MSSQKPGRCINADCVKWEGPPSYAVYAVLIEDTQRAFDELFTRGGPILSWNLVAHEINGAEAEEIVDGLASYNRA